MHPSPSYAEDPPALEELPLASTPGLPPLTAHSVSTAQDSAPVTPLDAPSAASVSLKRLSPPVVQDIPPFVRRHPLPDSRPGARATPLPLLDVHRGYPSVLARTVEPELELDGDESSSTDRRKRHIGAVDGAVEPPRAQRSSDQLERNDGAGQPSRSRTHQRSQSALVDPHRISSKLPPILGLTQELNLPPMSPFNKLLGAASALLYSEPDPRASQSNVVHSSGGPSRQRTGEQSNRSKRRESMKLMIRTDVLPPNTHIAVGARIGGPLSSEGAGPSPFVGNSIKARPNTGLATEQAYGTQQMQLQELQRLRSKQNSSPQSRAFNMSVGPAPSLGQPSRPGSVPAVAQISQRYPPRVGSVPILESSMAGVETGQQFQEAAHAFLRHQFDSPRPPGPNPPPRTSTASAVFPRPEMGTDPRAGRPSHPLAYPPSAPAVMDPYGRHEPSSSPGYQPQVLRPISSSSQDPKAKFLSLFSTFYDSLTDSRILSNALEEQMLRSDALIHNLEGFYEDKFRQQLLGFERRMESIEVGLFGNASEGGIERRLAEMESVGARERDARAQGVRTPVGSTRA